MGRVPGDAGLLEVPDEFEGIAIGAIGQNGGLFPGNNGVEASGGAWIVVAPGEDFSGPRCRGFCFPPTDPENMVATGIGKEPVAVSPPQEGEGLGLFVALEPFDERLELEGTQRLLQLAGLAGCGGGKNHRRNDGRVAPE